MITKDRIGEELVDDFWNFEDANEGDNVDKEKAPQKKDQQGKSATASSPPTLTDQNATVPLWVSISNPMVNASAGQAPKQAAPAAQSSSLNKPQNLVTTTLHSIMGTPSTISFARTSPQTSTLGPADSIASTTSQDKRFIVTASSGGSIPMGGNTTTTTTTAVPAVGGGGVASDGLVQSILAKVPKMTETENRKISSSQVDATTKDESVGLVDFIDPSSCLTLVEVSSQ